MSSLRNVWGEAQEYNGLQIYPVTLNDCEEFYEHVACLTYQKNKSQDIEMIKMSYLRFLFVIAINAKDENGETYERVIHDLQKVLELVFKQEIKFMLDEDQVRIHVNDIVIDESDFEHIRKIVCNQNLIRLDENILDAETEQAIKEAREFMAKRSNSNATLEEQIIAYHCLSGISYKDIKNYTIYQFNKGLERLQIIKNFEVYSSLLAEHGANKDIQHWLCHVEEKGLYDDVLMSKEEFDKVTSDSGVT